MQFLETSVFTKQITDLISDEEYQRLQRDLLINPLAGKLIKNTGGLRKLRWGIESKGRGKRGGIRIIYYYIASQSKVFMLVAYEKGKKDDLTQKERAVLRKLVSEEL
jgi:mRNA-degrading endonuclease RelE of RelBE toxin-antitoxin system